MTSVRCAGRAAGDRPASFRFTFALVMESVAVIGGKDPNRKLACDEELKDGGQEAERANGVRTGRVWGSGAGSQVPAGKR